MRRPLESTRFQTQRSTTSAEICLCAERTMQQVILPKSADCVALFLRALEGRLGIASVTRRELRIMLERQVNACLSCNGSIENQPIAIEEHAVLLRKERLLLYEKCALLLFGGEEEEGG